MKKGSINPHLYKARIGYCKRCNKEFRAVSDFGERKQKYCSADCYRKSWGKDVRPMMKNNPGLKGELNASWKGEKVGYWGIHAWVIRELGKPKRCEHCGDTTKTKYEWASIGHLYKRDLTNWIRLCTKCHRHMEKKML